MPEVLACIPCVGEAQMLWALSAHYVNWICLIFMKYTIHVQR